MIIHAVQTVLQLNKKYVSGVQIWNTAYIQNRLLHTLNRDKIRLNNKQIHFFVIQKYKQFNRIFYNRKNWFYLIWYSKKPHFETLKTTFQNIFQMEYPVHAKHVRIIIFVSILYSILLDSLRYTRPQGNSTYEGERKGEFISEVLWVGGGG